ncbi:hypothetical protein HY480_03225 [Candidatus Uhrbacteria bacterium]|nr:hypothetical protein [Candidatus Uhrbacteria bacterium]
MTTKRTKHVLTQDERRRFREGVITTLGARDGARWQGSILTLAKHLIDTLGPDRPFERDPKSTARIASRLSALERPRDVIRFRWGKSGNYPCAKEITLVNATAPERPRRVALRVPRADRTEQLYRRMEVLSLLSMPEGATAESISELARAASKKYGDSHRRSTTRLDVRTLLRLKHVTVASKRNGAGQMTQHVSLTPAGDRALAKHLRRYKGLIRPRTALAPTAAPPAEPAALPLPLDPNPRNAARPADAFLATDLIRMQGRFGSIRALARAIAKATGTPCTKDRAAAIAKRLAGIGVVRIEKTGDTQRAAQTIVWIGGATARDGSDTLALPSMTANQPATPVGNAQTPDELLAPWVGHWSAGPMTGTTPTAPADASGTSVPTGDATTAAAATPPGIAAIDREIERRKRLLQSAQDVIPILEGNVRDLEDKRARVVALFERTAAEARAILAPEIPQPKDP